MDHKTKGSQQQVIKKLAWEEEARVYQEEDQAGEERDIAEREEGDIVEREEGDGGLTSRPRAGGLGSE